MTSCSVNVIWLASESVCMWAFFWEGSLSLLLPYHPTILWQRNQQRGDEKGQVEGERKGEERKRWGGVSGAITVVLVREETSICLSLSEGIRTTFSLCHLIFSSPVHLSCNLPRRLKCQYLDHLCLQPPLFSYQKTWGQIFILWVDLPRTSWTSCLFSTPVWNCNSGLFGHLGAAENNFWTHWHIITSEVDTGSAVTEQYFLKFIWSWCNRDGQSCLHVIWSFLCLFLLQLSWVYYFKLSVLLNLSILFIPLLLFR